MRFLLVLLGLFLIRGFLWKGILVLQRWFPHVFSRWAQEPWITRQRDRLTSLWRWISDLHYPTWLRTVATRIWRSHTVQQWVDWDLYVKEHLSLRAFFSFGPNARVRVVFYLAAFTCVASGWWGPWSMDAMMRHALTSIENSFLLSACNNLREGKERVAVLRLQRAVKAHLVIRPGTPPAPAAAFDKRPYRANLPALVALAQREHVVTADFATTLDPYQASPGAVVAAYKQSCIDYQRFESLQMHESVWAEFEQLAAAPRFDWSVLRTRKGWQQGADYFVFMLKDFANEGSRIVIRKDFLTLAKGL
jgi:hypothetical protein